jgi:hypothetical protein
MCKPEPDMAAAHKWVLTFVFYWFAFMPLARGTALCGNLAMHAMLLATGYKVCFVFSFSIICVFGVILALRVYIERRRIPWCMACRLINMHSLLKL